MNELFVLNNPIYKLALEKRGVDMQISISIEESAEYIVTLVKFRRNENFYDKELIKEKIAEEMADNIIMFEQLIEIFGDKFVSQILEYKQKKLERLKMRLENDKLKQ